MTASDERILVVGKDTIPERLVLDNARKLRWTVVVPPGVSCDDLLTIELDAPGCELDLAALFLCKSDEQVRLRFNIRHNCGSCVSRQQIRGIVGGSARAEFDGLIYVKRDAQHTKAYQECHSILLNAGARVEARPQLEIYADDVECSHGATSGFLDPEQLFYMRSRGIDEDVARSLQLQAFLSGVLSRLPQELQDRFTEQL